MTAVFAVFVALLTLGAPPESMPGAGAVPSPTSPPAVSTWLGVTLGEAAKDVRAQLGKPRETLAASVGDIWRYDTDNGNVTLEIIINQGQVFNIAARVNDGKHSSLADPLGGALGMSAQALQTARGTPLATYDNGASLAYGQAAGVRWFYSLDNGTVSAIEVSMPLPATPAPEVVADAAHDGSAPEKAITVKAATQADAAGAEVSFLRRSPCESGGNWQVVGQQLLPAGGRYYDLYHVVCTSTKLPRDFYFDITDSFGK